MRPTTREDASVAVRVPVGRIDLSADVVRPDRACGLVIFAHGSGSSRHSPRNRRVAEFLNQSAIGTMLIDLLTAGEEAVDRRTGELRFDISLLGQRLVAITDWVCRQPFLSNLGIGYFGASTGAAAALVAAAERPAVVQAVVSRGGRPDLAGEALRRVLAPTLFVVGGNDPVVLDLNCLAMAALPRQTDHSIRVIPGASHLFEESGTLDQAASLARDWFRDHLQPVPRRA
ncbi:MAG: dienelactone hydrolase family protein [Bryobacteraceae bacterium]